MLADDADVALLPIGEWLVADIKPMVLVCTTVGFIVLIIACANVVNLTLAQGCTRAAELGVRAALGATRARLARELLMESLLLAVAGAAVGLAAAAWMIPVLRRFAPDVNDAGVPVDGPVALFAAFAAVCAGVAMGIAPVAARSAGDVAAALRRSSQRATEGRRGHALRALLVVSQCTAAVALLVMAGLLIRSFIAVRHVDPGFRPDGVYTAHIVLPAAAMYLPNRSGGSSPD
jgi:putative ABC transport system permease protein